MAVTYPNALKATRMTAVLDAIDAGAGAGKLVLMTSADAVLATLTLADPCGTVSNGLFTLDFDPDISATATGAGTAAKAKITTSADADVVTGLTVGVGAENIVLDNAVIAIGQTVTIVTGTITHG